jgi:hypothetical protein
MCWAFNHQNTYRNCPRAHTPFNLPFLVIYANTSKSNKRSATSMQLKTKLFSLMIWHIWITICHHLVCFFANQILFPVSKSNTLVWENREIFQE